MVKTNLHYTELKSSYLFYNIAQKTKAYLEAHPGTHLLRLGIGDVTLPLCDAVIHTLHEAVNDQASPEKFHGYMPECGADFFRTAVKGHYAKRNVSLDAEEIFVSSGASDELGDILDLFSEDNTTLIMEPAYPAYVDANIIAGHRLLHLPSSMEDNFAPYPSDSLSADLIYICSPNNPTGAVFTKEKLKAWVDYALANDAVLLSCLMQPMKHSLKSRTFLTAFLKSKEAAPVPLKSAPSPKPPALPEPVADIPLSRRNWFVTVSP